MGILFCLGTFLFFSAHNFLVIFTLQVMWDGLPEHILIVPYNCCGTRIILYLLFFDRDAFFSLFCDHGQNFREVGS